MKFLILFFGLSCLGYNLRAQFNAQLYFKNYGTAEGLPSPEVYCVFEDSQGFIWFGTDNGVTRFDGYEFQNYSAEEGLSSNVVLDIFEDSLGSIWLATLTGKIFIHKKNKIHPYQYNHVIEKYRDRFSSIKMVYSEKQSSLFVELNNLGILRIDGMGRDSLFTTQYSNSFLIHDFNHLPRLAQAYIYKQKGLVVNRQKILSQKKDFFNLKIISDTKTIEKKIHALNTDPPNSIFKNDTKDQYLIFRPNHLWKIEDGNFISTIPFPFPSKISKSKDGELWVGLLFGKGLRKYPNTDELFNNQFDVFLEGTSISNFLIDKKGGLWITTLEKGVFYCTDPNILIYNSDFGLSDNFVHTVTIKNKNELFLGCPNGDIFHLDIAKSKILNQIRSPTGHNIYDLFYHQSSKELWHGSSFYTEGLWKKIAWNNPKGKSKTFFEENRLIKKLVYDSIHKELLGLSINGFFSFDLAKKTVTNSLINQDRDKEHSPSKPQSRHFKRIYSILKSKKNKTWIGNEDGLFQLKENQLIPPKIKHPAFHSRVEDIDELSDSTLIFGTKGWGVIAWKNKKIIQISEEEGLTTDMIEDIHVDKNGVIWVGTLNGLNKITFDKNNQPKVRTFNISNGLPSKEVYKIESYQNQVWLCTAEGLVKFKEKPQNTNATTPIFQEIKVNNRQVEISEAMQFSHDHNNWTFQFLTINYQQNKQIPYRYRISENDNWQKTFSRVVNYPKLHFGSYTFEVQAQNEDGFWSKSATFNFSINPPWWQTWWALVLFLLSIGSCIFYFFQLQKRKLQKEASIQQQINNLERSALQAQMNPHFIFNCLNSIQNFVLKNDTDQAVKYLSQFAEFVRQVLNTSISNKITLTQEIKMVENYLALEKLRLKEKLQYHILVGENLDTNLIEIPPLLIQPYIENAIKHGIYHLQSKGNIIVNYKRNNNHLVVTIKDDGVGFDYHKIDVNDNSNKSVGMTITKKRLELLTTSKSDKLVQINSLQNGASGAEVIIKIKL